MQGQLQQVDQDGVQLTFEYLQGWRLHNLSGQSVPLLSLPCSKKVFSCVQIEFLFIPFVLIASCFLSGHHWEESLCLIFIPPSHQVFMHVGKIPWSLLFSRVNSPSSLSLLS